MENKMLNYLTLVLVIIGGVNWGLFGALELDLVALILGAIPTLQKLVYILVGVSAVYQAAKLALSASK
jgi:uncharacterized membrane protein YuzA (DUF378 family)